MQTRVSKQVWRYKVLQKNYKIHSYCIRPCLFVQGWCSCITLLLDKSNLYLQCSPKPWSNFTTWRVYYWNPMWSNKGFEFDWSSSLSLTPCPHGGIASLDWGFLLCFLGCMAKIYSFFISWNTISVKTQQETSFSVLSTRWDES